MKKQTLIFVLVAFLIIFGNVVLKLWFASDNQVFWEAVSALASVITAILAFAIVFQIRNFNREDLARSIDSYFLVTEQILTPNVFQKIDKLARSFEDPKMYVDISEFHREAGEVVERLVTASTLLRKGEFAYEMFASNKKDNFRKFVSSLRASKNINANFFRSLISKHQSADYLLNEIVKE